MTGSKRALPLFEQALDLELGARDDFLAQACGDDRALRDEIEGLLGADAAADGFLATPFSIDDERSGERLGPYRLLELIGSGGMGSVYRAERADNAYARTVAIKLLLIDARELRTRFALEQRILGGVSHPNIASLIDVGSDERGAPYLVMEFVEGRPITVHAREHALDAAACLRLFIKILDAVQTAHSQLIVHRDIKPGNVLVDVHGEPKLLDFGIAKLLDSDAVGATRTRLGPLTPEYASPEQVRGDPIGTGSDIYSLGVLLFELVTGEMPYAFDDHRASTIERTVCESMPARPSTRALATVPARSRRDLDAIVLKALEKSPQRRYASCSAFADDVRRWLDGEPVQAREAPYVERAQRFARRHRFALSIATAASVALIAGSIVALWQAHAASVARDRAERVNRFLVDMLSAANPADLGRKATVADVLDRAQRLSEKELGSDPQTAATTALTLARTYHSLGDLDAARRSGEAALAAARNGGERDLVAEAETELGGILTERGDFDAAEPVLHAARDAARGVVVRAKAANALGSYESQRGHAEAAQKWFETALAEMPVDQPAVRADMLNNLAIVKNAQNDGPGALQMHRDVVGLLREAYPNGHPDLAKGLANLANAEEAVGDYPAATATFAEALPMQVDLLGEGHPDVSQTLSSMTNLDLRMQDGDDAVRDGSRAWQSAQHLPIDHPIYAYAAIMYAQGLMLAGHADAALPLIRTALATRKNKYPADHPLIANTESVLGLAEAQAGDIDGGEALAQGAYDRLLAKLGDGSELTLLARQRLASIAGLHR